MSGGSWDYFSFKLEEVSDRLKRSDSPLRRAFGEHLKLCANALYEIEWSDSGDTARDAWIPSTRRVIEDVVADRELAVVLKDVQALRDALDAILQNTTISKTGFANTSTTNKQKG